MREWCNCGSSICARRRDVLVWRTTHQHGVKEETVPEPDKQGATSQAELAYREPGRYDGVRFTPDIQTRMGFTPNA